MEHAWSLLLLLLLQQGSCQIPKLRCWDAAGSLQSCSVNGPPCRLMCPDDCTDGKDKPVIGTGLYFFRSPVCRAAKHSGYLTPSQNGPNMVVVILRRISEPKQYIGSSQNDIISYSQKGTYHYKGSFFFMPHPEDPGAELDFASVEDLSLSYPNQKCLLAIDHFPPPDSAVLFQTLASAGTWTALLWESQNVLFTHTTNYTLSSSCRLLNFPSTQITTIPSQANASYLLSSITSTRNLGAVGTFAFRMRDSKLPRPSLVRNTQSINPTVYCTSSQCNLYLGTLTPEDEGVYFLNSASTNDSATFQLITRVCPNDKYGELCNNNCPHCGNGSACHDVIGKCLCTPGYNGTLCENACPPGYFGSHCLFSCPLDPSSPPCTQQRICLPKPFGCSCYRGLKGLDCDLVEVELPPVKVKVLTAVSATLSLGIKPPLLSDNPLWYIMFKKNGTKDWQQIGFPVNSARDSITLRGLEPNSLYSYYYYVQYGRARSDKTSPTLGFKTECGTPTLPPQNLTAREVSPGMVNITWELPDPTSWGCDRVDVDISYNTTHDTTTNSHYIFHTPPYTTWIIRAFLRTNQLSSASVIHFQSAEAAPEKVTNAQVNIQGTSNLEITWREPVRKNGILRSYLVKWRHNWRHLCNIAPDPAWSEMEVNGTEVILKALPSSRYDISIFAVTVTPGAPVNLLATTKFDVPTGEPQNLHVGTRHRDYVMVEWEEPMCNLSFGPIDVYQVWALADTPWCQINITETVKTARSWKLKDTMPYTTYQVMVAAGNRMGISEQVAHLNITTPPAEPGPPLNFTAYRKTERSLSFSWKAPFPPNGELEKFEIELWKTVYYSSKITLKAQDVTCPDQRVSSHSTHCYTISQLSPRTKYTIEIRASNVGVRNYGKAVRITEETTEAAPDPPHSLKLDNRTSTILNISWSEPIKSNGVLRNYKVEVVAIESFQVSHVGWNSTVEIPAQNLSYSVAQLHPASRYNISVQASTSVGYGPPTSQLFYTLNEAPPVDFAPEVMAIEGTTAQLRLTSRPFYHGPLSGYWVLVAEGNATVMDEGQLMSLPSPPDNITEGVYRAAWIHPLNWTSLGDTWELNFTVGDGLCYGSLCNPPLQHGSSYHFGLAAYSYFPSTETTRASYNFTPEPFRIAPLQSESLNGTNGVTIAAAFAGFLLMGFVPAGLVFAVRRKPWLYHIFTSGPSHKILMLNSDRETHDDNLKSTVVDEVAMEPVTSSLVAVGLALELHAFKTSVMEAEYQGLPNGALFSSTEAKKAQNKPKNRYQNLLPFDHNRVKLSGLPSDYINASWVDGYRIPKKYIVTQGPKESTVEDFWTMVWQNGASTVIMVTNLVENDKKKCDRYWPHTPMPVKYGRFKLTLESTETQADFQIHALGLLNMQEEAMNRVQLFHFTSWPDHDVPFYPASVASFMRRIWRESPQPPIVVHCSAGIGRSGVVVLVDCARDMAAAESAVNLPKLLASLRKQRANFVQTPKQYMFVYHVLVELLCGPPTSISCTSSESMTPQSLDLQYQHLSQMWQPLSKMETRTGLMEQNRNKNRNVDVVPAESSRHLLANSNYINAIYVDGYKKRNAFLVTQVPLFHTQPDFWQMVLETQPGVIVLLNQVPSTDVFFPQEEINGALKFGPILVRLTSKKMVGESTLLKLAVQQEAGEPKVVRLLQLPGWNPTEVVPPSVPDFLEGLEYAAKSGRGADPILIQCWDGVRACGVFVAAMLLYQKMKEEQEVDIYWAVKTVRKTRPHFITSKEQFHWLYKFALHYLDSFQTYANFH